MDTRVKKLGLVVRTGPFQGRSSRDQLDLALAAAALELPLEIFFVDEGVLQLLEERDPHSGQLPAGVKGWKALPELTSVKAWMAEAAMATAISPAAKLLLDVNTASETELADRLAECDLVLVT